MGQFKDLDKLIVNIDDPDYEQKVKDQTFTDFQERDKQRLRNSNNDKMHKEFSDSEDSFEAYCPLQ